MTTGVEDQSGSEGAGAGDSIAPLAALRASVAKLAALVEPLGAGDLGLQAYPSRWSIAEVLSHLGSGAVIHLLSLETILAGGQVDMSAAQPIWNEWNAKSDEQRRSEALLADRALVDRLESVDAEDRARFRVVMGPLDVGFDGFVQLRLNEHVLHTWDIAVTFDPTTTLPADAAELVFGALEMIARFSGKPTGSDRTIGVLTTEPSRRFEVTLKPDGVAVTPGAAGGSADLELPAEAFVRLVYGRLDPEHTPPVKGAQADLDELRQAFPGI
jgi:uncharacterized protein (TIGR03083 family)